MHRFTGQIYATESFFFFFALETETWNVGAEEEEVETILLDM